MNDQTCLSEIYRTLKAEAHSVSQLTQSLQESEWLTLLHVLGDCKGRIILSGCGTSAMAAQKIAHSLCCIRRPALFLSPSNAVHGGLGVVEKGDVCIFISKGGNTAELLSMLPAVRQKEAVLVAVTENRESALAKAAQVLFPVSAGQEPCPFQMLATASTLSVIAAFDALCIALMGYTGYTKEQFALIHPGGAVGQRLLEQTSPNTKGEQR